MFLHPDMVAVISHTRERWWRLPDFVRARRRERRNAYMRGYMRTVRQRSHFLSITLTDEQHHRLAREAQSIGRTPTACFREAAFAYFDRRILLPAAYCEQLADATAEIRRVGNNVNQLAHQANTRRKATAADVAEARRLLTALEAYVARRFEPLPLPASPPAAPDGPAA